MQARDSSSNRDGGARLPAGVLIAFALLAAASAYADGVAHGHRVPTLVPGDRILLLFDSTDGTSEARNPLSGEVKTTLERMGFLVSWHDVGRGVLPDRKLLPGLRAVVTGFTDAKLEHAAEYAAFVRDTVAAGVRYVIIGNYGAYEERAGGAFLSAEKVNVAFEALGVRYDAQWTDDPAKLTIEVADPALGPANAPVRIEYFSDYQCPFCGRVAPTVAQIREHYGERVRITWRNYPLPFHASAMGAAEAAMEAYAQRGNQGFFVVNKGTDRVDIPVLDMTLTNLEGCYRELRRNFTVAIEKRDRKKYVTRWGRWARGGLEIYGREALYFIRESWNHCN